MLICLGLPEALLKCSKKKKKKVSTWGGPEEGPSLREYSLKTLNIKGEVIWSITLGLNQIQIWSKFLHEFLEFGGERVAIKS